MTDDMVIVLVNAGGSNTFHTDPDCHVVQRDDTAARDVSRDALGGQYDECPMCADGDDPTDNGTSKDWDAKVCPKCGEDSYHLGIHLPACDGGESA